MATSTLAFLFCDIEGSAQRWESGTPLMHEALQQYDRLLRAAVAPFGGHVFKTMGDTFCIAFPEVAKALGAARAGQLAVAEADFGAIGGIAVRMAVHVGGVEARDGDYFGQPLNRTHRLLSIAHGGQILVSTAAATLARGLLPDGVTLRDLGFHRLKDLTQPEHVHQLLSPDLAATFPQLRSLDLTRHNLPEQPTSFIGREAEIAAIGAVVLERRLVTLFGTGGLGKTRLSLQVAADLLDQFADGAWFVELAPLTEASLVAETVAGVLGLLPAAPGRDAADLVIGFLRQKRLLLILDNCEHLLSAAAALADAIGRHCPNVAILASSREALGVPGEQVWPVPVLPSPILDSRPSAAEALTYPAVRLFVERAEAALGGFTLTDEDAPAVAAICQRLDGIALAIELAAPRLKMLKPAQLLSRLNDRFRLLTGGSRTALPRQQTLRALIDWSHTLLSDKERVLLRRLSVFAGSWSLESAAAAAGDPIEDWEIFDLLSSLVEKSLVTTDTTGVEIRYRFMESTRVYASEKLTVAGEAGWIRRMAEDLAARLKIATAQYETMPTVEWLAHYGPEIDNLRAALDWAFGPEGDKALGLELRAYSSELWTELSLRAEGRRRLEVALLALSEATPATIAARLQTSRYARIGLGRTGVDELTETVAVARLSGDKTVIARALIQLSARDLASADVSNASVYLEDARAAVASLGPTKTLAHVLSALGAAAYRSGDMTTARQHWEQGLIIARETGDRRSIDGLLQNMAEIMFLAGDTDAAIEAAREALSVATVRQGICPIAANLGAYLILRGNLTEGVKSAVLALDEAVSVGEPFVAAWAIQHLALAIAERGFLADAAILQAYVDQVYNAEQATREPTEQATCDRTLVLLAGLPSGERAALAQEGARLSLDAAKDLALSLAHDMIANQAIETLGSMLVVPRRLRIA